jgi:hypothetical protein
MTMKWFLPNFSMGWSAIHLNSRLFSPIPKVKTALKLRIQGIKDIMDFENSMQPSWIPSVTILFKL